MTNPSQSLPTDQPLNHYAEFIVLTLIRKVILTAVRMTIIRISRLARASNDDSDVSRYQTSPVSLMSVSAQYGAIIMRSSVALSGNGSEVNCGTAMSKDMSPLLFTCRHDIKKDIILDICFPGPVSQCCRRESSSRK